MSNINKKKWDELIQNVTVKCRNKSEAFSTLHFLSKISGRQIHDGVDLYNKDSWVGFSAGGKLNVWASNIASNSYQNLNFTFDNLPDIQCCIDALCKNETVVSLDSIEYKAVVTSEGITVGCQKISFQTFDKIAAAVKEHRQ